MQTTVMGLDNLLGDLEKGMSDMVDRGYVNDSVVGAATKIR